MSLGENIYKLRTGKRMSQEDFAAAMEVSRQSVSKWENDMAVPVQVSGDSVLPVRGYVRPRDSCPGCLSSP